MPTITGKINEPVKMQVEKSGDWKQTQGPRVNLRTEMDGKSASFTPSLDRVYEFTCSSIAEPFAVQIGQVDQPEEPEIPPVVEQPSGTLLYNSNTHGKWNDGRKRTVTESEGNTGPNGKGLYMAASGDPELIIDGNGVAHLVSGSGTFSNISFKHGRHGMGGAPEHRWGGTGGHLGKNEAGLKIEKYHNEHEKGVSKSLSKSITEKKWHTVEFKVNRSNGKIQYGTKVDYQDGNGFVEVVKSEFSNPPAYYMNEQQLLGHSEGWIRVNNEDHGRVYFCVCAFNFIMRFDFMIESGTSVALRNVTFTAI